MKTCLLLSLILFSSRLLFAQWQEIPDPKGAEITGFAYTNGRYFAGGKEVIAGSGDGKVWSEIQNVAGTGYWDIEVSGSTLYCYSYEYPGYISSVYSIFQSFDNGTTWSGFQINDPIEDVFFSGYRTFAVPKANANQLIRTDDFGFNWELSVQLPADESPGDVVSWNGQLRMATRAGCYASTNNGDTWTKISNQDWGSVDTATNITLFPIGAQLYVQPRFSELAVSNDGGVTWKDVPGLYEVKDMLAFQGKIYVTDWSTIYVSADNGQTWAPVKSPLYPQRLGTDGIELFATGSSGIFRSSDGGNRWFTSHLNLQKPGGQPVYAKQVVEFDGKIIYRGDLNYFESSDGGLSWEFLFELPPSGHNKIIPAGPHHCMVPPLIQSDAGGGWTSMNTPGGSATGEYFDYCYGNGQIFAQGRFSGNIWRSSDFGVQWVKMGTLPSPFSTTDYGITNEATGAGALFNTTFDNIYISNDQGASWQSITLGIPPGTLNGNKSLLPTTKKIFLHINAQGVEKNYYFENNQWKPVNNTAFKSVVAWNNLFFAYREGLLLVTSDDWASWQNLNSSNPYLDYATDYPDIIDLGGDRLYATGTSAIHPQWPAVWRLDLTGFGAGIVSGKTYFDTNGNGQYDNGESPAPNILIQQKTFNSVASSGDPGGVYNFFLWQAGNEVAPVSPSPYYSVTPLSRPVNGPALNLDFGFRSLGSASDLAVYVVANQAFRPGFVTDLTLTIKNFGTSNDNASLELQLPPGLLFQKAFPNPGSVTGNLIKWTLNPINSLAARIVDIEVKTNASAALGTVLNISATVQPTFTMDQDNSNNAANIVATVVGSFDPNDKTCTPDRIPPDNTNQELTYVVRFQNTGNFPATFIRVVDTLSALVDISTLKILSSSHPMTWSARGAGIVEFFFNDIHLPDSILDERGSHGFVQFSVTAKGNLPLGTIIENQASIYFDYNVPIRTNTVKTPVAYPVGTQEAGLLKNQFRIVPNPAENVCRIDFEKPLAGNALIQVFDTQGKMLISENIEAGQTTPSLDLSAWPGGLYFVKITAGNGEAGYGKVVKE